MTEHLGLDPHSDKNSNSDASHWLAVIADSAVDSIALFDPDGATLYMNRSALAASHFSSLDEARGALYSNSAVEEFKDEMDLAFAKALAGELIGVTYQSGTDDNVRWWHCKLTPARNGDGQIFGIVAVSRDISKRHQEDEEMLITRRWVEAILRTIGEGVVVIDGESCIQFVNQELLDIFGFNHDELMGRHIHALMPDKYHKAHSIGFDSFMRGRPSRIIGQRIEIEGQRKNGDVFPIDLRIEETRLDSERRFFTAAIRDISKRKQDENELIKLSRAIEQTSGMVMITDANGLIEYVNPEVEQVSGYSKDELIGKSPRIFKSGVHDGQFYDSMWQTIISGKVWRGEMLNRSKSGDEYNVEQSISAVVDQKGVVTNFVSVMRNVTEWKRLQRQLVQADKMKSLGALVAGVAHEINNPNNFIMISGQTLTSLIRDIEPVIASHFEKNKNIGHGRLSEEEFHEMLYTLLDSISEGSMRIKRIVEKLKKFTRQDTSDRIQDFNVNQVVSAAVSIVGSLIKESTDRFEVVCADDIPPVAGNSQEIEQVIINLITNACHALPDRKSAIVVTTEYSSKTGVVIRVDDEGVGVPGKDLEQIMDPFFTTRRDRGGTGLGLSISYNIVENHGGTIDFISEEGKGSTVTISLPPSGVNKTS